MHSQKSTKKGVLATSLKQPSGRFTPSSFREFTPTSHAHGVSTPNDLPEREIDFTELDDTSFVETIEDPADTMGTALAIFKNGRTRVTSRLEYHGQMLVPIPRSAVGFSDVKLPSGVMPYKSVKRLFHLVISFMELGIDVSVEYFPLISAFVLYTWVADSLLLPIAVYLSLIGPRTGL